MDNAVSDMQKLIATRLQRAAISTRVYSQELINIDVRIESGLAFYGEQRDLLELVGNLLDNACKYGNGQVRVTAHAVDSEDHRPGLSLMVEDNGPGIAESNRELLLQRGVRGDERVEGHGLGLAIVLEIVSAYNGEINIEESDLGGAKISVSLRP